MAQPAPPITVEKEWVVWLLRNSTPFPVSGVVMAECRAVAADVPRIRSWVKQHHKIDLKTRIVQNEAILCISSWLASWLMAKGLEYGLKDNESWKEAAKQATEQGQPHRDRKRRAEPDEDLARLTMRKEWIEWLLHNSKCYPAGDKIGSACRTGPENAKVIVGWAKKLRDVDRHPAPQSDGMAVVFLGANLTKWLARGVTQYGLGEFTGFANSWREASAKVAKRN